MSDMTPLTSRLFVSVSASVLQVANEKAMVEVLGKSIREPGCLDIRVQNRDGHTWLGYVPKDAYLAATKTDTRIR